MDAWVLNRQVWNCLELETSFYAFMIGELRTRIVYT